MKKLELTKIGLFNPGRLTDEEIEMSFVTRIAFFQYIFKKIIAEKPNSIPQHHLVIGQRGMGKTSLLVRIAVELRKKPYSENFIALTFPEEQYNIDRLSKFWLNCLDALADALDRENQTEFTKILDAEIDGIAKSHHQENNAIYAIFEQWTKKINRRPVLLVDNLNLIFDKISKEEQHQLRAILMSNNAPIMLGASATTIDDTVDYGAAFYDAFLIQYLKKLTLDESIEVLQNLAKITGKQGFEQIIYQNKARLGALYELTGGTPRTISMLFPLVQDGFSTEIQTDLDALLDMITPLYKARFEELPAQLQVVLDAIALHWEPMTIEQLRNVTQLENAQLSPQLKRLVDVGWLQKLDAFEAKGSAYELSERFFNIWYLMRRSSRRQKRELYCLSKFIESMYGEEVEDMAHLRLGYTNISSNQVFFDLALADTLKNKELREKLLKKSYNELLELSKTDKSILKDFSIPIIKIQEEINKLNTEIGNYLSKGSIPLDTLNEINTRILALDENNVSALYNLGFSEMAIGNYSESEKLHRKVLELNSQYMLSWNALGEILGHRKKFDESEKAFLKSVELDENFDTGWSNLGLLYSVHFKNYTESERVYLKAINLDSTNPLHFNRLANLYVENLNRLQEAEALYLKALELDQTYSPVWVNLGHLYCDKLFKFEKAENAYLNAIKYDENEIIAWAGLGNLYQNHLQKYDESEQFYLKAIQINPNFSNALNGLGILYYSHLKKYTEAEKYLKKAIEVGDNIFAYNNLGTLYMLHLGKYKEAETLFLKSLSINSKDINVWNSLGNLYQIYLGKYSEAETAYLNAIAIDNNFAYPKYNLVFLYRDKLSKLKEAKEIFESIPEIEDLKDCHFLNEALFAYYEKNAGIAKGFIIKALNEINDSLPYNTQDDWWKAAATIVKLGFGTHFLQTLSENGYDIILKPYYVAIQALIRKNSDLFFNSIAAEVREPAKKILEIMKKYNQ
jgi:tetratricopeptide (TPR) repeat protein